MKKINYILMALIAVLTLASCSKDDNDPDPEPKPVDNEVTLVSSNIRIATHGTIPVNFTELSAAMQKAFEQQISSDYGKVTVASTGTSFVIHISTTESHADAVIDDIKNATDSICKAVDMTSGLIDLTFSLVRDSKSVYDFTYESTMYSPLGNWRTTTEDGSTCTLFVENAKDEKGYDAALTYNGKYRLGKVEYDGKKGCDFVATDSLAQSEPVTLGWYFDGGNKKSFEGAFTSDETSDDTFTFNKIDIDDELITHYEYKVVDSDNELPSILGDKTDALKTAVSECSFSCKEKDYTDKYSFWEALLKYTWDVAGKVMKVYVQYEHDYPALQNTNAYILLEDYAIINEGTFMLHSNKIYFNPNHAK